MSFFSIEAIAQRLAEQDNAATAHPVFVVQERERIWDVSSDYADGFIWVDDEGEEHEPEEGVELPAGFSEVGYLDRWDFVVACFTRAAAQRYIEENRHNLRDPRVWVASAHRNKEWQAVVAFLPAASRCISAAHAVVEYIGNGQRAGGWELREAKRRLGELRAALTGAVKPKAPRGAQRDIDFAREAQAACEAAAARAQGAHASLPGPVIDALEMVSEAEQRLSGERRDG